MRRFDAVIFDLDGTLLDTERLFFDCGMAALAALGHPPPGDLLHMVVGVVETETRRRISAHYGPAFDYPAFETDWHGRIRDAYEAGIPLRPGIAELLAELDARAIPRAVATNTMSRNARIKIAGSGLLRHIAEAHVACADHVARPKPSPDVFLHAASLIGADPARCLAVEDSAPGVAAALAAGMTVLHVPDLTPAFDPTAHHVATSALEGVRLAGLFD